MVSSTSFGIYGLHVFLGTAPFKWAKLFLLCTWMGLCAHAELEVGPSALKCMLAPPFLLLPPAAGTSVLLDVPSRILCGFLSQLAKSYLICFGKVFQADCSLVQVVQGSMAFDQHATQLDPLWSLRQWDVISEHGQVKYIHCFSTDALSWGLRHIQLLQSWPL